MSPRCSTRLHSPLKTVLGKIRGRYQAYCTTYKMHTMATPHGGAGWLLERSMDIHAEDCEHANIDDESNQNSDATVALRGPEAEEHPEDPVYNNHDKLTSLTREINDLHQWVETGEGQLAETLDYIEHELQNLSIALHPTPTPTSTEPFGEVIWTPCVPHRSSQI